MRTLAIGLFVVSLVALLFSACGTQGSGGAGHCENITFVFPPGIETVCDRCVNQHCCAELSACQEADRRCIECASHWRPSDDSWCIHPDLKTKAEALTTCAEQNCLPVCDPEDFCYDGKHAPDGGECPQTTEPDGGVTFADCTNAHTSVIRGTLDGKPFDQTYEIANSGVSQHWRPYQLNVHLYPQTGFSGSLQLIWDEVCLYPDGAPVPVVGAIELPEEIMCNGSACLNVHRIVNWCSLLWQTHDASTKTDTFRFNLLLDNGDQLTGCARP